MADPTPLSPAAQAVLDAAGFCIAPYECLGLETALAAALRAAADQVVPEQLPILDYADLRQNRLRHELLAIAAELEAGQWPSTTS